MRMELYTQSYVLNMTRRIDKKQGNVRGFPALLNTSELWSYHQFPTHEITIFTVPQTDNPTTQIDGLQTIQNIKMEEFTYEQIRAKALKQGIKDNKVHIGLWANFNNYLKTRRKKNGKVTTYYISLQKLAY